VGGYRYRGGLKSPRIVQEEVNEPTILSLVSTGRGVGLVLATARWRCPESVVILPVVDLNVPLTLALAWRKDNTSRLLANFIAEVRRSGATRLGMIETKPSISNMYRSNFATQIRAVDYE
jgi:DNA-binding transcriptional LysR family regulator